MNQRITATHGWPIITHVDKMEDTRRLTLSRANNAGITPRGNSNYVPLFNMLDINSNYVPWFYTANTIIIINRQNEKKKRFQSISYIIMEIKNDLIKKYMFGSTTAYYVEKSFLIK